MHLLTLEKSINLLKQLNHLFHYLYPEIAGKFEILRISNK